MSIKIRTQRLAVKCGVPAILPLQEINVKHLIAAVMLLSTTANADDLQLIAEAHQPANIAASRGFTFWKWLMARNYDLRHWSLYNEFNQLENKK